MEKELTFRQKVERLDKPYKIKHINNKYYLYFNDDMVVEADTLDLFLSQLESIINDNYLYVN